MKKIYLIFLGVLLVCLFLPTTYASVCGRTIDTYYVNDDGDATGCAGYDFTTISEAVANDKTCAKIIVCDGTYNDTLLISGADTLIIEGEAEGEVLISTSYNGTIINIVSSEFMKLKNLNINASNGNGISTNDLDNFTLENIQILNADVTHATGIGIYNSSDFEIKGNFLIESVNGTGNTSGLKIQNSTGEINTDSFEIKDVTTSGVDSDLSGLVIKSNSTVDIKTPININQISSTNHLTNGISIDSSIVNFDDEVNVGIIFGAIVKAIKISDSEVNFNNLTNINLVVANSGAGMGVEITGSSDVIFENDLTTEYIGSTSGSYGLWVVGSNVQLNTGYNFSNFTPAGSNGIYATTNSDIFITNPHYEGGTNDIVPFYLNYDSKLELTGFELDFAVNTCFYLDNEAQTIINNSNLNNCTNKQIDAVDSNVYTYDTAIDNSKVYLSGDNDGFISENYSIDLDFINQTSDPITPYKVILKAIDQTDPNNYKYIEEYTNSASESVMITYQESERISGVSDIKVYHDYNVIAQKNQYNEVIHEINLTMTPGENFTIQLGEQFPENVYEMHVNKEGNYIIESFIAEEIVCSGTIDGVEIYGCYNIDQSFEFMNDPAVNYSDLLFSVPYDWMTTNLVPTNNVKMYHYNGATYEPLETIVQEIPDWFFGRITEFSEFAFGGEPAGCLIDDDCNAGFSCTDQICQCTLSCEDGFVLNPDVCECVEEVTEECTLTCDDGFVLDEVDCECVEETTEECTLSCDDGFVLNPAVCECVVETTEECTLSCDEGFVLNPDVCECIAETTEECTLSCDDGFVLNPDVCECVEETQQSEDPDKTTQEQINDQCDITCPDYTTLDEEYCVCVAKSPTDNKTLYIVLIIIAIILVGGGIATAILVPKHKHKKSKKKVENKSKKKKSKKKVIKSYKEYE